MPCLHIAGDISNYVASLPPSVRPYLENQLDWDNDVDTDLQDIAYHMDNWDSTLATHLKLTKRDVENINCVDPVLQR